MSANERVSVDQNDYYVPDHVNPDLVRYFDVKLDTRMETDPYGTFLSLREGHPDIFFSPAPYEEGASGYWVLTRFEDIRYVFTHPDKFSCCPSSLSQGKRHGRRMIPLELQAPDHAKFRAIITRLLTPKKVDEMEGEIRKLCVELVDDIAAKSECDFMEEFARQLPIQYFMTLMGWPQDRRAEFKEWGDRVTHAKTPEESAMYKAKILDFLKEYVQEVKATHHDSFGGMIAESTVDGRELTDDELLDMFYMLFIGGLDTVTSFLGHVFRHLANNPEDRQKLIDDPALIPQAVEELLRLYSVVSPSRNAIEDVEYKGVTFKKGDKIYMPLNLANRDEAHYPDPLTCDFLRGARDHGGFGFGPHMCAGKVLARKEVTVALQEFLKRIPNFSVKPESHLTIEVPASGVVGLRSLPLVLG